MLFTSLFNKRIGHLQIAGLIFLCGLFSCNQPDVKHPVPLPEVKDTTHVSSQTSSASQKDTPLVQNMPLASEPSAAPAKVEETPSFSIQTVYDSATLWGYDIYFGKKLVIRQRNIPSMPGVKGFATEDQAKRTGNFVAWKVSNNIFPPTVNKQELDSLGVLQ